MNLDSRLRKLEEIQNQANVQEQGIKTFITYNDRDYYLSGTQPKGQDPLSARPVNYRDSFTIEGKEAYSRVDLEKLNAAGWTNLIISYVEQPSFERELIN